MNRYFDLSDAKITLCVGVKPGSAAALATPERIRDSFKQKGTIREIEIDEYMRLTKAYTENEFDREYGGPQFPAKGKQGLWNWDAG